MAYDVQFVAVEDGNISTSPDGENWEIQVSSDGDDWRDVWCNGLEDQRAGTANPDTYWVVVSQNGYYYAPSDAGDSPSDWTRKDALGGDDAPASSDYYAVSYGGAERWLMVGDSGLAHSYTDIPNGTFDVVDPSEFEVTLLIGGGPATFTGEARNQAVRVRKYGGACSWYVATDSGTVFRTLDATGLTGWEIVYQDEDQRSWSAIDVNPNDGTVYVVGAVNGMIWSNDDGESWTEVGGDLLTFPANRHFNDLAYSPSLDQWIFAYHQGVLFSEGPPENGSFSYTTVHSGSYLFYGIGYNYGNGFSEEAWTTGGQNGAMATVWTTSRSGSPNFTILGNTFYVRDTEPPFASGGEAVTSYRLPDVCACEPYDPAAALGDIEKIARASKSVVGGRSAGKGLSMLTEHTDTMWCRDRGTLTNGPDAARAVEG